MRFTKGQTPWNKGVKGLTHKPCSEATKAKIAIANTKPKVLKVCACGQPFGVWPSKANRAKYCSKRCMAESRVGKPSWNKGLLGYRAGTKRPWMPKGEAHWSYKKDRDSLKKSGDGEKDRRSSACSAWRMEVWRRDRFKCRIADQCCAGRIEAHHILGWTEFPELRYQPNNGITLCHAHHPRKRAEEKRLAPIFSVLVSASNTLL